MDSGRFRVLFLCTGNSCRSQMAEGFTRHLAGELIEVHSAGVAPGTLDPLAVQVMAEEGIDISAQRPTDVAEYERESFDLVVTVCDHAREICPLFHSAREMLHRSFEDPPRLATSARSAPKALAHYRRVRDEIRAFVADLPRVLREGEGDGAAAERESRG